MRKSNSSKAEFSTRSLKPDELLFVYGTLRQGTDSVPYQKFMDGLEYFAIGYMRGCLFEVDGYPGAIESNSKDERVWGDLFVLRDPIRSLNAIDEYEECSERFDKPHEYVRKKSKIYLSDGDSTYAWSYIYNRPTAGLEKIKSGDYLDYLGLRHSV